MRYPNREVRRSLHISLLRAWTPDVQAGVSNRMALCRVLAAGDLAGMQALLTVFFASIPHQWHINNPITNDEGYYASVFYSYFAALGLDVTCDQSSIADWPDKGWRPETLEIWQRLPAPLPNIGKVSLSLGRPAFKIRR